MTKKPFIIIGFALLTLTTELKAQQSNKEYTHRVFAFETKEQSLEIDTAQSVDLTKQSEMNALVFRLNEIKNMDKSNLSFSEKRQLRQEVRSIKKSLQTGGGGIYISAGAIIIILLLLIILL